MSNRYKISSIRPNSTNIRRMQIIRRFDRSPTVRIVMVRRREEGGELSSCSYLSQYDALQRNDRRRDSQKDRIQSGRSRVLATNWLCRQGFQLPPVSGPSKLNIQIVSYRFSANLQCGLPITCRAPQIVRSDGDYVPIAANRKS
jgi:hypothetical protein